MGAEADFSSLALGSRSNDEQTRKCDERTRAKHADSDAGRLGEDAESDSQEDFAQILGLCEERLNGRSHVAGGTTVDPDYADAAGHGPGDSTDEQHAHHAAEFVGREGEHDQAERSDKARRSIDAAGNTYAVDPSRCEQM
jgi:hypothetical protein